MGQRRTETPSRLMAEMTELANDMRVNGTMDQAMFEKITMRELGPAEVAPLAPLSAEDVRAIRERARMSQAVFAKHLNLTVGYLSQLERGAKRATGSTLALLTVIRRKGIDAVI